MEQKAPQEEAKSESYFHLENKLANSAAAPAPKSAKGGGTLKRSVVPRSAPPFPMLKVPPPGALSGVPSPKAQQWGVVISIVIIVFMIVTGAFYAWGKRIAQERALTVPSAQY